MAHFHGKAGHPVHVIGRHACSGVKLYGILVGKTSDLADDIDISSVYAQIRRIKRHSITGLGFAGTVKSNS